MPNAIKTMLAAIPPYWKTFFMALTPSLFCGGW
jgi:hypothetical protein